MNKTRTRILEDMIIKKEKIQSTSSSLKVENTVEGFGAKIVEIASNRLFQEKRQGYNKLGKATLTTTDGGIDLKLNEDNSFILNGTTTKSCYIDFEIENISIENLTVVFNRGDIINSFGADVRLVLYNNNTSLNDTSLINKTHYSITPTQEINRARIWIQAGNTFNSDEFYPMILEGTYTLDTIPEYEKYGKMPSLEHKSEIEGISGDVVVKTQSKNLINNNFKLYRLGQSHKARAENELTDTRFINTDKNLIFSTDLDLTKYSWAINILNYPVPAGSKKDGFDSGWMYSNSHILSEEEKSFLKNFKNLIVVVAKKNNVTITDEELAEIRNSKFQLEYEDVATDFVEHQEQVEKISLGDKVLYGNETARDKIIRKNGKWYFENHYKKCYFRDFTLQRLSSNVSDSTGTRWRFKLLNVDNVKSVVSPQNLSNIHSNIFSLKTASETYIQNEGISIDAKANIIIFSEKLCEMTNTEINNYFSDKDDYFVVELENAEMEEIADEKLINQLNKLLFLKEYEDTTNFEFDKDVIFDIEVTKDNLKIINSRLDKLEEQNLVTQALSLESEV